MSEKKTVLSISVDANMLGMVNVLKLKLSHDSRASVLKDAIRRMYRQEFPLYMVNKNNKITKVNED